MAYVNSYDYKRLIQADNLTQIINADNTILAAVELTAQAEAASYLTQKYIVAQEFIDTPAWSPAVAYEAGKRVMLDATAYNATTGTYALNALTLQAGNVYRCTTAIVAPEAFNLAKWALVGAQYAMYYTVLPKPLFNLTTRYRLGEQVYWKNKTYTCVIPTGSMTQAQLIQYGLYSNVPPPNVFPDDVDNGTAFWGNGINYSVSAGTALTDTTKWAAGDNRNQQLLTYVVDICLYHLHTRIAPRNIPDLRVKRYDDAIQWLKMAGRGEITADLPVIQPKTGARVRFGGRTKNVNSY